MSEEDWFERAIRERDGQAADDEQQSPDDGDDAGFDGENDTADAGSPDPADSEETDGARDTGADWDAAFSDDDTAEPAAGEAAEDTGEDLGFADDSPDESGGRHVDDDAGQGTDAGSDSDPDFGDQPDDSSGSLFDDDFGAAMGNVQMPDVDDGAGGGAGGDVDDGFDVEGNPFDVGNGEFDMASDDFGMGGGGFDTGGGFGTTDFDADEFESELPRINLGIKGLDEMIMGGVPERSLMVAVGSAGTGKTTFGLQFLDHGMRQGERGIFITLEENRDRVINSATEKGMPFDEYVEDGLLAVVDIDPIEMANSLGSIRSELPRLISQFGASRLVLDSVSLLEMMYDDRAKRRNEIYDFTKSLKEAGITTMMTSEASEDSPYASRHGIVEYLTDAVFILQYVRPSDFRETRLAVEIQKIRDANHSRETKPYEITEDGISVHRQANIF
ncbi:KaiC domain-containing protein [Haloarchaeobius amylolyticus]|uniref:KaiC domain-containing protein n=1 Tax=Haloarchaeobius amylolyticus TaxID=1198296 RepID=UPI0022706DB5|nr:KaiC domain-containing protein [Haloarchaeobius amylolyticus]